MKTVAIDTSLPSGSVAALDGERMSEVCFAPAQAHARRIAAALTEATAALGWSVADADLVAVIRGPGSFTGLRVGIAAAKGIAWAGGMKIVGVSGFEVIGASVGGEEPIHVVYDAGRGDLFAATVHPAPAAPTGWQTDGGVLVPIDAWVARLPLGATLSGPGLDLEAVAALVAARGDLRPATGAARLPSAAVAGRLGLRLLTAGATGSAAELAPDYLRPSYAQENGAGPSR
jgi:tRNA threonylcarbamoyladenosine biosynthesis protein TsaB